MDRRDRCGSSDCRTAPQIARPAPVAAAPRTLGIRSCQTIWSSSSDTSCAGAVAAAATTSVTVPTGIDTEPMPSADDHRGDQDPGRAARGVPPCRAVASWSRLGLLLRASVGGRAQRARQRPPVRRPPGVRRECVSENGEDDESACRVTAFEIAERGVLLRAARSCPWPSRPARRQPSTMTSGIGLDDLAPSSRPPTHPRHPRRRWSPRLRRGSVVDRPRRCRRRPSCHRSRTRRPLVPAPTFSSASVGKSALLVRAWMVSPPGQALPRTLADEFRPRSRPTRMTRSRSVCSPHSRRVTCSEPMPSFSRSACVPAFFLSKALEYDP